VSVTGRGSSSAGQPKGEPAALGWPVVAASLCPEVGDGGSGPGGPSRLGGELVGEGVGHTLRRRSGRGGGGLGRLAGQGPGRRGGGLRLGLGEGGILREEVGEAGRPKAKAQVAGPKTGDGPKLKKKFLLNFKLNLGIWLDIVKLHN
jgi:hypothetical protein